MACYVGVDACDHLGMGKDVELIGSIVRHKCKNIKKADILSDSPSGREPRRLFVKTLNVYLKWNATRTNHHYVHARMVAHRKRNLIIALAQLARHRELRCPLCPVA